MPARNHRYHNDNQYANDDGNKHRNHDDNDDASAHELSDDPVEESDSSGYYE